LRSGYYPTVIFWISSIMRCINHAMLRFSLEVMTWVGAFAGPPPLLQRPSPGTPLLSGSDQISVASYNLDWRNVNHTNRWSQLYESVRKYAVGKDLIGFQECEDVGKIVRESNLVGYEFFMGVNTSLRRPAPIAWNTATFEQLSQPQQVMPPYPMRSIMSG